MSDRAMSDNSPRDADRFADLIDCTPVRLILFLSLILFGVSTIFTNPQNGGGTLDWQFFQFFDEIARKTILQFHQFPIWNPYFCGGTSLIGNPQTTFLVPTFPLVLIFGTTFGMRLSEIVMILVGCEGGYRLMRHFGVRGWAAVLGAVAFPLYGRTFGWLHDGQHGLHGILLAPWILYGYLRGLKEPAYLVLGGAFFGWLLAYRGIEPGPQFALALMSWAIFQSIATFFHTRSIQKAAWPILAGAVIGLLGAGFVGMRLVPVIDLVLRHPRVMIEKRSFSFFAAFVEVFFVPPRTRGYSEPGYAYIGAITYCFFVIALILPRSRKRAVIPLLVSIFFMSIILGYTVPAPYPVLKMLPLYKSLRNPALYSFTGAMFIVLCAAIGADEVTKWFRRHGRVGQTLATVLIPILVLGTVLEMDWRGRKELPPNTYSFEPVAQVRQDFHQSRGNHFLHPIWPYLDRGTLSCYDETPFPTSDALRPDLAAEEYLADPSAGDVKRVEWTPNRIELSANLTRPATVLVNQNYDSGWSASVGLLAIDLPAGEHHVTLRIWPKLVTVGLLYFLLTVLASIWIVRRWPPTPLE